MSFPVVKKWAVEYRARPNWRHPRQFDFHRQMVVIFIASPTEQDATERADALLSLLPFDLAERIRVSEYIRESFEVGPDFTEAEKAAFRGIGVANAMFSDLGFAYAVVNIPEEGQDFDGLDSWEPRP